MSLRPAALLIFLLTLAPVALRAQGGGEQFSFDDIPVDDVQQRYVAAGIGYMGMVGFPKYDALNALAGKLGLGSYSGPIVINGGGGFVSTLVVPNLRLGLYGAGGSKVLEATRSDSSTASLRFGTQLTAVHLDYSVRIFRSFTMFPSVMIGPETYDLEMTQSQAGGAPFDTIFSGAQGSNGYAHISNSHVFYYPSLNFEYTITRFLMLRVGAGYKGTFGGSWTDAAGTPVNGVPDINTDGLTVQFGAFLGLFPSR